jgi:hypothetical protein
LLPPIPHPIDEKSKSQLRVRAIACEGRLYIHQLEIFCRAEGLPDQLSCSRGSISNVEFSRKHEVNATLSNGRNRQAKVCILMTSER